MITIRQYIEDDELLINPVEGIEWNPDYTVHLHTILYDRKPLGIAGVEYHGGEYYVGAYTDQRAIDHPLYYLKAVKSLITKYIASPDIPQLITMMKPDSIHIRWIELLGFVKSDSAYAGWYQYEYTG